MVDTSSNPDANLAELLVARARHATDRRLATDVVVGLAVVTAAWYWHGPAWYLLLAAASSLVAFGVWGIADRELSEHEAAGRPLRLSLRVLRVLAGVVGFAAAAFVVMAALGVALGKIIS